MNVVSMGPEGAARRPQDPASGAGRVLWTSTAAFTACFAVWTIFAIIGLGIKKELGLSETEFGLLAGMPVLTGSLSRILLGIWADRYGGRRIFAVLMVVSAAATFALSWANSYATLLLAALFVGMAGGTFSVGVAYVARFYPPAKQNCGPCTKSIQHHWRRCKCTYAAHA